MLIASGWQQNQPNTILFVLVDSNGSEVSGLSDTWDIEVYKNGGSFQPGAGVKSEIGNGWYKYISSAGEADTPGPVAIRVTHASAVQQNLEYVVETRVASAIDFTYTITDSVSGDPIASVLVDISTDAAGNYIIWRGVTDAFGVARDDLNNVPRLAAGTYYFWRTRSGYTFSDPDTEVVS